MTLPLLYSGKVRDIYDAGDDRLLMVASDRISAFDVVLPQPIPHKGRVLTGLTEFWLGEVADVVPNHLISTDGPAMLVRKADMLPIECIVRGYISGSAWKEYRAGGTVHGMAVPAGLRQSDRLPEPLFTPSTKAAVGEHDENISFDRAAALVGAEVAGQARAISLEVYRRASERALAAGLIIADTKFELGWIDGALALCDEVLTPDSSRFWEASAWTPGTTPASFDKQPVRDWLESSGWDKRPPPPDLPPEVVEATSVRYLSAYERLTGQPLGPPSGAVAG
ncbi:MAG: phosphoribosylaminoimidazolesuccinocarboxamide synthase [Actinomycetota bacterium]|nr:phosphoribosylaminoimidazolesuccinocarboxamide synthase [Actinomycetota bacterium]